MSICTHPPLSQVLHLLAGGAQFFPDHFHCAVCRANGANQSSRRMSMGGTECPRYVEKIVERTVEKEAGRFVGIQLGPR